MIVRDGAPLIGFIRKFREKLGTAEQVRRPTIGYAELFTGSAWVTLLVVQFNPSMFLLPRRYAEDRRGARRIGVLDDV